MTRDNPVRRAPPPRWAAALNRLAERAMRAVPNGRVPLRGAIDAHKACTGPFVLVLMAMYDVFTVPALVYLALHGSYGVAWVVKDLTFPDRRFDRRVSLLSATGTLFFLSLYWVAPAILVLGSAGAIGSAAWAPASAAGLAAATFLYAIGLVLMIGADVQKNAVLDARRSNPAGGEAAGSPGLITTGFYARVRHPNYLGEMLIYGSFALVVGHWLPWAILVLVWGLFFLPNMLAIEASLSRYPQYRAWKDRTGFLLPRPSPRTHGGSRPGTAGTGAASGRQEPG